jgi:hypothetical protein
VSFVDHEGVRHSVPVEAESLFEAAVLALARFRGADVVVGPAADIDVSVSEPVVTHSISLARVREWLSSTGRSPKEQATKARLRELLGEQG